MADSQAGCTSCSPAGYPEGNGGRGGVGRGEHKGGGIELRAKRSCNAADDMSKCR